MEAKLLKEDLAGALSSVLGVVEKRQTLPILANVLIEFSDNGVIWPAYLFQEKEKKFKLFDLMA